jgi:hypothetical protein
MAKGLDSFKREYKPNPPHSDFKLIPRAITIKEAQFSNGNSPSACEDDASISNPTSLVNTTQKTENTQNQTYLAPNRGA